MINVFTILINHGCNISFFIYILSNFMHTKFYIFWKRAFPFSLEMLGGIAFFMAVFLAVFA